MTARQLICSLMDSYIFILDHGIRLMHSNDDTEEEQVGFINILLMQAAKGAAVQGGRVVLMNAVREGLKKLFAKTVAKGMAKGAAKVAAKAVARDSVEFAVQQTLKEAIKSALRS